MLASGDWNFATWLQQHSVSTFFGTPCRFIYKVVYQKITRWVAKSLWRPEYCRWQCHQQAMNNQETKCWDKQLTRETRRATNFSAHIWNQYHSEFSEMCINPNFPQKILFGGSDREGGTHPGLGSHQEQPKLGQSYISVSVSASSRHVISVHQSHTQTPFPSKSLNFVVTWLSFATKESFIWKDTQLL